MKFTLLFSFASLSLFLSSCNTIAGIGEDISATGKALNNTAEATSKKIDTIGSDNSQQTTKKSTSTKH